MVLEGLRLADQVDFALHIVIGISEQGDPDLILCTLSKPRFVPC
jgi:hypothetical protein